METGQNRRNRSGARTEQEQSLSVDGHCRTEQKGVTVSWQWYQMPLHPAPPHMVPVNVKSSCRKPQKAYHLSSATYPGGGGGGGEMLKSALSWLGDTPIVPWSGVPQTGPWGVPRKDLGPEAVKEHTTRAFGTPLGPETGKGPGTRS